MRLFSLSLLLFYLRSAFAIRWTGSGTQRLSMARFGRPLLLAMVNDEPKPDNMQDSKTMERKIDKEMIGIAVPAFIALAADPLASIVDAMFVHSLSLITHSSG